MLETIRDSYGNKIVCYEVKKGHKFYLHLKSSIYPRLIANFINGELHFIRNPDHIFVKTNSYGFNDNFIRKFPPDTIVIVREKGFKLKLKTTIGDILRDGHYLHFYTQGFEKQIFLNRSLFDKIL